MRVHTLEHRAPAQKGMVRASGVQLRAVAVEYDDLSWRGDIHVSIFPGGVLMAVLTHSIKFVFKWDSRFGSLGHWGLVASVVAPSAARAESPPPATADATGPQATTAAVA